MAFIQKDSTQGRANDSDLKLAGVARFWWPLAASWLLMAFELPSVSATLARLPEAEIMLGSYGVVFSISLIIEAPIIMLLVASTALSKDWDSFVKLRRFTLRLAVILTGVHILVAFTPLFDLLMTHVIGLPEPLFETTRLGLRLMTPWTGAIAVRRFNQGVLIRFDHTRSVGMGTAVRLAADGLVLAGGFALVQLAGLDLPGIAVGTSAVASGVTFEALYIGLRVRPVVRNELTAAPPVSPALDFGTIVDFYVPLALTSLIYLAVQPMGTAALTRAPLPIESLAVWPVITGTVFLFRAMGIALNEVVVALMDRPKAAPVLRRFTIILTLASTLPLVVAVVTPLSRVWFLDVAGLTPDLAALARSTLPLALAIPAAQTWISWFQGNLTYARRTRSITESVVVSVTLTGAVLWLGVAWGGAPGTIVAAVAFSAGALGQTAWLWVRHQQAERAQLAEAPAAA